MPIKNDCWSQKDCHSKIFPLNFLITSSGSLTLTGFKKFQVLLVCSVTDNTENDSIGGTLLKVSSNLANRSKKLG